ncbi:auxin-responsive protein SAUR15 [Aristolochia californica]|uniref:auxin-responsive protein SAUR15 n=1 Tax=Aristolochia californica TaxID=171875 RepID=UPI0035D9241E
MEKVMKLAKKVKGIRGAGRQQPQYEALMRHSSDEYISQTTPIGFLAVYVGDERQRFVVPTSFLSHPLFKMLLEKAYKEYGFEQTNGLVVPCSVSIFEEVVSVVECCHGQFDIERLVDEFL